jgi:AhpD family alkylhydroperoxidase
MTSIRMNYVRVAPGIYHAMRGLEQYLAGSGLEPALLHLVRLRASQVNGCAYCIDMHWKDLRALGETEQRLYSLDAWRECPWYSDRERAALAWTEAVTLVAATHVPDAVYAEARAALGEKELADLTLAVVAINGWNRLAIAARDEPGTYQPAKVGISAAALAAP